MVEKNNILILNCSEDVIQDKYFNEGEAFHDLVQVAYQVGAFLEAFQGAFHPYQEVMAYLCQVLPFQEEEPYQEVMAFLYLVLPFQEAFRVALPLILRSLVTPTGL